MLKSTRTIKSRLFGVAMTLTPFVMLMLVARPQTPVVTPVAALPVRPDTVDLAKIYGRIQFVDHFPDYKVEVVDHFPDLKVQLVDHFPDGPGKWMIVDAFPDFKIQLVDHFPDFTIQYVDHFPGVR